ncbi:hypothetical protein JYU34_009104 [Plutella xylostella]|uniref:Uncharacterized protein n=1 Tax=Plutella xylostella TaxID=51655 RepID=A0ABQ7QN55_PLUXY|nr:hypothetical protein JYU34_009104 [Plutella xylostella]
MTRRRGCWESYLTGRSGSPSWTPSSTPDDTTGATAAGYSSASSAAQPPQTRTAGVCPHTRQPCSCYTRARTRTLAAWTERV